ncbi:MAG TPA: hypothetical protein VLX92_27440, partial [Kofleriaceae bacterium]|nr:hypothetical protein [Kofleriaceae bacterium]
MRAAVGLVIAIAACEGQAPQRSAPAHVSVVGSPAEPPPPGSDALIAVPPEVAAHVALREVARGLHRPVLVTAAPGDVRDRLFVVEQRGAIRVLEHGQLAARPFFTIGGLSDGEEQGLLG